MLREPKKTLPRTTGKPSGQTSPTKFSSVFPYPNIPVINPSSMSSALQVRPAAESARLFSPAEKKAYSKLVGSIFPKVKAMVCDNNGNLQDAEDIFQDGLIAFSKYQERLDALPENDLQKLLYTICRNKWRKRLKKSSNLPVTFHDSWEYLENDAFATEWEVLEAAEMEAERIRILSKYLFKLKPTQRRMIELIYFEGKSHKEVAETLGYSGADSVKSQVCKYLHKLRELMGKDGVDFTLIF